MVDACGGGGGFKNILIIHLVQVIMINISEGLYPHTHEETESLGSCSLCAVLL